MSKPYKQGVFIEELKNRFLCLVKVDGEDTLCYIPSSCRLSNFIDLKGKTVLLSQIKSSKSRTKYSLFAVKYKNSYVLLNIAGVNSIIADNINNRCFSFIGLRPSVKTEHLVHGYKSDLYVEKTKTVIEIKSILSFDKNATFPSVYSQRAIDQLNKINGLLDNGYRVCYLFVSLNPKIQQITINETILEYRALLLSCIKKGMLIQGVSLRLKDEEPIINSKIKIVCSSF